jgi:SAM-dependent methyltransferase
MDYQRLYQYRFRAVDQASRQAVWGVIARFLHQRMGHPKSILDPAAGRCEFINAVPSAERWVVDAVSYAEGLGDPAVRRIVGDALAVELPHDHFEGVFVSNFLEHLADPEEVARFLGRMRAALAPGGRIAILGPNFRYCAREYFDCADHRLALTHVSVEEHLYAAGFEIVESIPRFLPYSFRGALPATPLLTRAYLGLPPAWRLLGRQFLVIGRKQD